MNSRSFHLQNLSASTFSSTASSSLCQSEIVFVCYINGPNEICFRNKKDDQKYKMTEKCLQKIAPKSPKFSCGSKQCIVSYNTSYYRGRILDSHCIELMDVGIVLKIARNTELLDLPRHLQEDLTPNLMQKCSLANYETNEIMKERLIKLMNNKWLTVIRLSENPLVCRFLDKDIDISDLLVQCKPMNIQNISQKSVVVSYINKSAVCPWKFYIRLAEDNPDFRKFTKTIKQYCVQSQQPERYPTLQDIVIAFDHCEKIWCRCEVKEIRHTTSYILQTIDYGNTISASIENIRHCPASFKQKPAFAALCEILGAERELSNIEYFCHFSNNKVFKINILRTNPLTGVHSVQLLISDHAGRFKDILKYLRKNTTESSVLSSHSCYDYSRGNSNKEDHKKPIEYNHQLPSYFDDRETIVKSFEVASNFHDYDKETPVSQCEFAKPVTVVSRKPSKPFERMVGPICHSRLSESSSCLQTCRNTAYSREINRSSAFKRNLPTHSPVRSIVNNLPNEPLFQDNHVSHINKGSTTESEFRSHQDFKGQDKLHLSPGKRSCPLNISDEVKAVPVTRYSIAPVKLTVNKEYEVEFVNRKNLNPLLFWLRIIDVNYEAMQMQLNISAPVMDDVSNIHIGDSCVAHIGSEWHRAKICSFIQDGIFSCSLVDIGEIKRVKLEDLKYIQREFIILPAFAFECSLRGVEKVSDAHTVSFQKLSRNLKSEIVTVDRSGIHSVILKAGDEIINFEFGAVWESLQPVNKLPELKFPAASAWECSVIHVSSLSDFYITLNCRKYTEVNIKKDLQNSPKLYVSKVNPGDYVLVRNDGLIQRAVVKSNLESEGQCTVYIVDSGYNKEVDILEVSHLPEYLMAEPAFALHASLGKVAYNGTQLTETEFEILRKGTVCIFEGDGSLTLKTSSGVDIALWLAKKHFIDFKDSTFQYLQYDGSVFTAYISACYKTEFFVQPTNKHRMLQIIKSELASHSESMLPVTNIRTGIYVSIKWNSIWLRGNIISSDTILAVDYGWYLFLKQIEDVRLLPTKYMQYPAIAIKCKLAKFQGTCDTKSCEPFSLKYDPKIKNNQLYYIESIIMDEHDVLLCKLLDMNFQPVNLKSDTTISSLKTLYIQNVKSVTDIDVLTTEDINNLTDYYKIASTQNLKSISYPPNENNSILDLDTRVAEKKYCASIIEEQKSAFSIQLSDNNEWPPLLSKTPEDITKPSLKNCKLLNCPSNSENVLNLLQREEKLKAVIHENNANNNLTVTFLKGNIDITKILYIIPRIKQPSCEKSPIIYRKVFVTRIEDSKVWLYFAEDHKCFQEINTKLQNLDTSFVNNPLKDKSYGAKLGEGWFRARLSKNDNQKLFFVDIGVEICCSVIKTDLKELPAYMQDYPQLSHGFYLKYAYADKILVEKTRNYLISNKEFDAQIQGENISLYKDGQDILDIIKPDRKLKRVRLTAFISTQEIYVRNLYFDTFLQKLERLCKVETTLPIIGNMYGVYFNKNWHRVIVQKIKDSGQMTMHFIDIGTTVTSYNLKFRLLPPEISRIPATANIFSLAFIEDLTPKQIQNLCEEMRKLVDEEITIDQVNNGNSVAVYFEGKNIFNRRRAN